jgi:hypothetical protein
MTSERHNVRLVDRADEGPLAVDADAQADRADWRSSSLATAGLTILIGIWLAISPALFDYKKPALPVIWGLVILVIAALRMFAAPRSRVLALFGAVAGVLTALTAFVASDPAGETANMALMGLAATVLSLIGLSARVESDRQPGT